MKQLITLIMALLLLPFAALSADDKAPEVYVYATYLTCDPSDHDAVDDFVKKSLAPSYNQAVKDNTFIGWGWMSHHTGGQWNRIFYQTAPSIKALFAGQDKVGDVLDKKLKDATPQIQNSCPRHDDYIWQIKVGNPGQAAGKVGISVYMKCNISKEQRADEIVKKTFAPVYDKQVKQGKLKSWGWLSHVVGGKYRRLATMTADNYDDLFAAREQILNTLFGDKASDESKEFGTICTSHQDYLWDMDIRVTK